MFSYGNNFASSSSSYLDEQNNNLDLHGYSFDVNSNWSSASTTLTVAFDFNASIAGPSTVTEDQWLEPPSNGEYAESTVLDAPWGGSTDQYGFQTGPAQSSNVFETNVDGCKQHFLNIPERQQHSATGQSWVTQPAFSPSFPSASLVGPMAIPPPLPTPSWGYSPLPQTSSTATGSHQYGTHDQPPTTPNSSGQGPYPTFVGKGKAKATDHTATEFPSVGLSTAVASSSGPQRPERGATRKGIKKGSGRRKRPPKKTVPPDIDWHRTYDRFYWEMIQAYLLQPSGGSPTPEAAYAKINKFIKEDLHQSPLVVRELGVRPSREQEQYLTGILEVLYPARDEKKREVQCLLDQVADEIERGLFMVNDAVALRDGSSHKAKPEDLDDSATGVRHREVEKERRDASHGTLRRMSFFFKAPPRSLSRNKVLFFAITYIMFGVEAFGGDGFVIPLPKR